MVKKWDSEKYYEHLDEHPMRFKTEADFRRALKDRGLKSGALL